MSRIFNRLRIIFDSSINCGNILDKAAEFHPSSTLFHTSDALPYKFLAETEMDLCSILKFVNRVGNLLLANGLQQYDRVAIFKTNNIDYFFLALAVVKAGGIAVPINSGMRVENLEYYLNNVGTFVHFFIKRRFTLTGVPENYRQVQKAELPFNQLKVGQRSTKF